MRKKYSTLDQIVLRKASNGNIRFGSIAQKSNAISTAIKIVQDRTSTGYPSGYYEGDVSRSCVSIFGTYLYIITIVLSRTYFYSIFRFIIEFVRAPDSHIGYLAFDWLTMGQLLSIPMIFIGIYLLIKSYRLEGRT